MHETVPSPVAARYVIEKKITEGAGRKRLCESDSVSS